MTTRNCRQQTSGGHGVHHAEKARRWRKLWRYPPCQGADGLPLQRANTDDRSFYEDGNMMFNIYDYPELFKGMMNRIADDTLAYYRMLEEKHLICQQPEERVWDRAVGATTMNCRGKKKQNTSTYNAGRLGIHGFPGDSRSVAGDV